MTAGRSTIRDLISIRRCRVAIAIVLLPSLLAVGLFHNPIRVAFGIWRAQSLLRSRDADEAIDWLVWGQSADPTNAQIEFLLARSYRRLNRTEEAVEHLNQARVFEHPSEELRREAILIDAQRGHLNDVKGAFADLFVDPGGDGVDICEAYVVGCIQNYAFAEAQTVLGIWKKDFPKDAQPHFLHARILEHLFSFGDAKTEYRSALQKKQDHAGAAYGLARLALTEEDATTALEFYQMCRDAMHRVGPAEVGIAASLRRLERLEEAREVLLRVKSVPADELKLAFLSVGDTTEDAQVAVQSELGEVECAAGNHEKAVEYFLDALNRNPRAWRIRFSLATALQRSGRAAEAKPHFERFQAAKDALELCHMHILKLRDDPAITESRYELGRAFLEHISERQGLVWLNSVLTYDPKHGPTHELLADYFESQASENETFRDLARMHRQLAVESRED